MKFCPECENILYYNEESNKLMNFCKTCGYKNESSEILIQSKNYKENNKLGYESRRNYIYDPTYARTIYYKCPNTSCKTHEDESKKEAIFFNENNSLKQVFVCAYCHTEWKY
jgi:DNA-directed RNA polymerase subunit M/transcription elongation factor TFIIS